MVSDSGFRCGILKYSGTSSGYGPTYVEVPLTRQHVLVRRISD